MLRRLAVVAGPRAPLVAVDVSEVAGVWVGPFVPDAHAVVLEVVHVGVAAQKPQQFVDDGLGVELLGGEQGESLAQVEVHLASEHASRAGAGAVGAVVSVGEDVGEQVEVLFHGVQSVPSMMMAL